MRDVMDGQHRVAQCGDHLLRQGAGAQIDVADRFRVHGNNLRLKSAQSKRDRGITSL